jgi:hypothetical protein
MYVAHTLLTTVLETVTGCILCGWYLLRDTLHAILSSDLCNHWWSRTWHVMSVHRVHERGVKATLCYTFSVLLHAKAAECLVTNAEVSWLTPNLAEHNPLPLQSISHLHSPFMDTFVSNFSPSNIVKTTLPKVGCCSFRTRQIWNTDTFKGWRLPVAVVIIMLDDTIGIICMTSREKFRWMIGTTALGACPFICCFIPPRALFDLQPAQRACRYESITLKLYCFGMLYRVGS